MKRINKCCQCGSKAKIINTVDESYYCQQCAEDWLDGEPNDTCEKCGRWYTELEHEFQKCYKCGWDADEKEYGDPVEPDNTDIMSGDADFNGRWV